MDGSLGMEDNRQALLGIVARLAVMLGAAKTLPRRVHRAALRLLRPAEWAARRLVIAVARGIVAPPAGPTRPRRGLPLVRPGAGTGIVIPWRSRQALRLAGAAERARRGENNRLLALPLFDPLPRRIRLRPARSAAPRIGLAGGARLFAVPDRLPPRPYDRLDAGRLSRRIAGLSAALQDLPRQALRYARLAARAARPAVAGSPRRARRIWPLRSWGLPGKRTAPEVHALVKSAHAYAYWALRPPDG